MALETGTYISDLVSANPPGTDAISQGDDHIRLLKSTIQASFPSTLTSAAIPNISGNGDKLLAVNSAGTQTEWVTETPGVPSGCILMWSGAISAIPSGWVICDGNNSTPNLTDRFVIHASADSGDTYDVGDTGGSTTSGSHSLTEAELASHTHTINNDTHNHDIASDSYRKTDHGTNSWVSWLESSSVGAARITTSQDDTHNHTATIPVAEPLTLMRILFPRTTLLRSS